MFTCTGLYADPAVGTEYVHGGVDVVVSATPNVDGELGLAA